LYFSVSSLSVIVGIEQRPYRTENVANSSVNLAVCDGCYDVLRRVMTLQNSLGAARHSMARRR